MSSGEVGFDKDLPDELRRLSQELVRIDVLVDDPVFVAPFVPRLNEAFFSGD